MNITGRDLPCEAPATCPCTILIEWNDILAASFTGCSQNEDFIEVTTSAGPIGGSVSASVSGGYCSALIPPGAASQLPATPAEAAACIELLSTYCHAT